jgi:hypothetical protein
MVVQSETNSPGLAALADIFIRIADSGVGISEEPKWDILVGASEKLLRIVKQDSAEAVFDSAAFAIAELIFATDYLRGAANARNATNIHNQKARAGKKQKTEYRWRIIRCAIVWVCSKQKLKLSASDCFAESIRQDVIEASRRFGLFDLRTGTSIRSIQRHISALLKDRGLLSAILGSEELRELF